MVKRKSKTRRIKYKRKRKRATKKYRKHKRRVRTRIHRRITKKHRGGVKILPWTRKKKVHPIISVRTRPKRKTLFSKPRGIRRYNSRGLNKSSRSRFRLPPPVKADPAQDARMDSPDHAPMDLAAQPHQESPVPEAKDTRMDLAALPRPESPDHAAMDLAAQPHPESPVPEARGKSRKRAWDEVRSVDSVKADPEETIQQLELELEKCKRILKTRQNCLQLGVIGSGEPMLAAMDVSK